VVSSIVNILFHSLQFIQDSDLIPIHHASDIQTVIHGTYLKNWTKIKTEGLSRMNRLHIHFSPGELGDSQVVSGIRSSCQLYIYIDAEKALTGKNLTLSISVVFLHCYVPLLLWVSVIFWITFLS
jgi:RNA:NAD 2'-phosphotransferase (TPT1/KptA family)